MLRLKFNLLRSRLRNTFLNLKVTRRVMRSYSSFIDFAHRKSELFCAAIHLHNASFRNSLIKYRMLLWDENKNKFVKIQNRFFKIQPSPTNRAVNDFQIITDFISLLQKDQIYIIFVVHTITPDSLNEKVLVTAHLLGTFETSKRGLNCDKNLFIKDLMKLWQSLHCDFSYRFIPNTISNEIFNLGLDTLAASNNHSLTKADGIISSHPSPLVSSVKLFPGGSGKRSFTTLSTNDRVTTNPDFEVFQTRALDYLQTNNRYRIVKRQIMVLTVKFSDTNTPDYLLENILSIASLNLGYVVTIKINTIDKPELFKVCDELIFLCGSVKHAEKLIHDISYYIRIKQQKEVIETSEINFMELSFELICPVLNTDKDRDDQLNDENVVTELECLSPNRNTSGTIHSIRKYLFSKRDFSTTTNGLSKRFYSTNEVTPFNKPLELLYEREEKVKPIKLVFSYSDIYDIELIMKKVTSNLDPSAQYTVTMLVRYDNNNFLMAGRQFGFNLVDKDGKHLSDTMISKIVTVLNNYGVSEVSVEYIQLTFRPNRKIILSEFGLKDPASKTLLNKFGLPKAQSINQIPVKLKHLIDLETPLTPISVNENGLGTPLRTVIDENGLISDIIYVQSDGKIVNFWNIIKDKTRVLREEHPDKVGPFPSTFKFYVINSAGIVCILGINYLNDNTLQKIRFSLNGVVIDNIRDTEMGKDIVERTNGKLTSHYKGHTLFFKQQKMDFLPVAKLNMVQLSRENPFIGVIDTETFICDDETTKVYCLGFKTNLEIEPTMYYVDSVNNINSDEIVLKLMDELLRPKYNLITFYFHNLSYDATFIMGIISKYNEETSEKEDHYKMDSVWRDKRLLSLTVSKKINGRKQTLIIQDSAAILPGSLRSLALDYEVKTMKGIFPYKFASERTLFYIGDTPNFKYYENITLEVYKELVKSEWNFKEESLSYLNDDLSSLYQVIRKANQQLLFDYGMDLTKCLTISKLALNLFLTQHYPKQVIPNIDKSSIYQDIKLAYYGGKTEVYCPHGKDLYHYDVNSLYPSVAFNSMPGLNCTKMEKLSPNYELKENLEDLDQLFGFYSCNIEAPLDSYLGLLPVKAVGGNYFPVGKWSGWYFSEELKFAQANGYKITVVKGYSFTRETDVFKSYVNEIYEIKSNSTGATRAMAKSLLNNLLGRFGIKLERTITKIMSGNALGKLLTMKVVKSSTVISEDKYMVSYIDKFDLQTVESNNMDILKLIERYKEGENQKIDITSVVIPAAINAYARIYLTQIQLDILKQGGKIFYSDTDSIVTDMKLPAHLVSDSEIGKFKYEYNLVKGIFIAGKTYLLDRTLGSYNPAKESPYVIRAKGVKSSSLSLNDFIKLLYNINIDTAIKTTSSKDWAKGHVSIKDNNVTLYADSYDKRTKLFNSDNRWINTKPIVILGMDDKDQPIIKGMNDTKKIPVLGNGFSPNNEPSCNLLEKVKPDIKPETLLTKFKAWLTSVLPDTFLVFIIGVSYMTYFMNMAEFGEEDSNIFENDHQSEVKPNCNTIPESSFLPMEDLRTKIDNLEWYFDLIREDKANKMAETSQSKSPHLIELEDNTLGLDGTLDLPPNNTKLWSSSQVPVKVTLPNGEWIDQNDNLSLDKLFKETETPEQVEYNRQVERTTELNSDAFTSNLITGERYKLALMEEQTRLNRLKDHEAIMVVSPSESNAPTSGITDNSYITAKGNITPELTTPIQSPVISPSNRSNDSSENAELLKTYLETVKQLDVTESAISGLKQQVAYWTGRNEVLDEQLARYAELSKHQEKFAFLAELEKEQLEHTNRLKRWETVTEIAEQNGLTSTEKLQTMKAQCSALKHNLSALDVPMNALKDKRALELDSINSLSSDSHINKKPRNE